MLKGENLTVKQLIKTLQEYDDDMVVCIELGGFAPKDTTTIMSTLGFISGSFYIKKSHRVHKEYLMQDEVPAEKASDFVQCLVLNAHVTKQEVEDSGL